MDAQTRYGKRAYFSGKRFVPLIFHLFSIEGGARHPWQLSAIATAIATWLGALSRSHGTRAHHKGGANSGEVQKTAQGERKGCTRTWKTNAPRAHRVVHRAHRAYVSLIDTSCTSAYGEKATTNKGCRDGGGHILLKVLAASLPVLSSLHIILHFTIKICPVATSIDLSTNKL